MNSPAQLLAIDVGYGVHKVFGPTHEMRSFRSTHGVTYKELPNAMGVNRFANAVKDKEGNYIVFGDYGESVVGKRFMRELGGDRVSDPFYLSYFGAAVSAEFQPGIYNLHVVYGLPVDDMDNANLKRRIVTALKRPDLWSKNTAYAATDEELKTPAAFHFETPAGNYHTVVERVTFMAQPMGTAWNYLLTDVDSCAIDAAHLNDLRSQKWMVIDIGSGTLDISTITKGIPTTGESGTLQGGVNFLVDRLEQILMGSPYFLPSYSQQTLQEILRSGSAPDPSQPTSKRDVSDAVEQSKDDLWHNVVSFMVTNMGKAYEYDLILVTGGGGILLIDHVRDYFNVGAGDSRVVLSPHPMYDNVVGWYKHVRCVVLGG